MTDRPTHRQLMAMRDTMQSVLRDAMDRRDQRQNITDDGREAIREQMTTAVNTARTNRGLSPVTLADVGRLESLAAGHVDYFEKFSFYCAEYAVGARHPKDAS